MQRIAYRIHSRDYRSDGTHALSVADGGPTLKDRFFAQSSFATFAIANEGNTVKVRSDAPVELPGPLGCGIQTGAGTVLRALRVGAGASFVVTGAGAVGLSAVMAALVAGATTIIAVDVVPARLELAGSWAPRTRSTERRPMRSPRSDASPAAASTTRWTPPDYLLSSNRVSRRCGSEGQRRSLAHPDLMRRSSSTRTPSAELQDTDGRGRG
jgi:hypothetical protein